LDGIPLWAQIAALVALLVASGFFSISETSMMAISRLRLRHLAKSGNRAARLTQSLLERTDRLLGAILLGNNLVNAAATALVTAASIHYFGDNRWALLIATVGIAFLLLVFAEITPKVIGATYPERIALPSSFALRAVLWLTTPAVWFINLFVRGLLWLMRIRLGERTAAQPPLTQEELRTAVLESASFIPAKHRSILLNLFDLEQVTVDDLMAPRARVEALDISTPIESIRQQLATCYHNKLPVADGDLTRVIGILNIRKLLPLLDAGSLSHQSIRDILVAPYFVPSGTPILQQLQMFQDNQRRLGLVVDEYGEVKGLVTLEDIVEEIVGEFTTQAPGLGTRGLRWDAKGHAIVNGSTPLRELNRRLSLRFSLEGPRTLNGLVLEALQEFPSAPCCIRFEGCIVEVIQIHDQSVRSVRLIRTG
jgi:Mg2+/Co2+ transporter CorB